MKQIFKTTLLAATIAATCGAAVAGTITATKQTHSTEGLNGVTANQTANTITYTLGAAYANDDLITFTFPAGALVAASLPNALNVPAVDSDTPANAIAGMALGLLNSDSTSVTYRVTTVSQPHYATDLADPTSQALVPAAADGNIDQYTDRTTIGAAIMLSGVQYTAASVKAANVTITADSVTNSNIILDSSGTRTATIADAKTQFGTAVINTMFDGVIDVSAARMLFTPNVPDSTMWTITNPDSSTWENVASVNATAGTVATLKGAVGQMTGLTVGNWGAGGTRVFDAANAMLTVSHNGQATNDTITFTAPGTVALETQSFNTDLVYNYMSAAVTPVAGSTTVAANLDSGAWTLNGAMVNIPYMPYAPGVSQIIYVTNEGAQGGDISVTAFDDAGTMYDLGVIATAAGKEITKITLLVADALTAAGFTSGKVSLTVTVNAPAPYITVYSAYNVGGNRGFVNNSQYKGM